MRCSLFTPEKGSDVCCHERIGKAISNIWEVRTTALGRTRPDGEPVLSTDCVEKAGHQYPNMADRRHNDSSYE
jgi:hypothetical protein